MKKILFTLILFASIATFDRLQAQSCTISNLSVHYNGSSSDGNGNCLINVDLSFDLDHNNGFKYVWIHLWQESNYPSPALDYSKPPTATELANTVGNIGLNYSIVNNVPSATVQTSYPNGTAVPVTGGTVTISPGAGAGGADRFTISSIVLKVPGGCNVGAVIKGDDWGTNSQSQNSVQCSNTGFIFLANDPTITGFKVCSEPRTLNIGISTTSTTPITVAYKLYKDDGDGIFEPSTNDVLVADSTGPYTISSGSPYSKSGVGYTGNNAPGEQSNIWVSVTNSVTTNTQNKLFINACAPLPVQFISFNAKRNNSASVSLTWQTAMESNNAGFAIERNTDGSWKQVGFVPSQAPDGNSQSVLSYAYTDQNTSTGITQYRLRQIDIDGKSKYSDVRAVRGLAQSGKTIVYPNPSSNGTVNVVFEDVSVVRDISLNDITGRLIKNWKGVSNNNLQIENLSPGFYALKILVRETGEQTVEKIIVNKR